MVLLELCVLVAGLAVCKAMMLGSNIGLARAPGEPSIIGEGEEKLPAARRQLLQVGAVAEPTTLSIETH